MRKLSLWLVILAGAGLLAPAAQAQDKGLADLKAQVVEHTLPNGLRLILLPRREVPVFSYATVANVGSVDEHVGITGIAHMFEHMAFKGTTRIGTRAPEAELAAIARVDELVLRLKQAQHGGAPEAELAALREQLKGAEEEAGSFIQPNELDAILSRFGAVGVNATTGVDFTTYFYSLPSNKLELWMSLESDRFLDPVLREFYQERDVVKEERFMRIDSNPIGRLIEEFLGVAYLAHPYGRHGIGYLSDLETITRQEAVDFYKKYYVPGNLIVAVVGDIDPPAAIAMAENYFGRLPAAPLPDPVETVEPVQRAQRRVTLYAQSQPVALMGYHKPAATHPDEPVYQALSAILSSGRTSRLYQSLIERKKLASDAGGFGNFPGQKYPNMFVFYAFATPGHTNEEVLAAMHEEIDRLQREPVSEAELLRVKAKAKSEFVQALSSGQGLAVQLAQQAALSGDWRELFDTIDKINAVTAEDIQRVARATFVPTNLSVAVIEPEPPQPAAAAPAAAGAAAEGRR
jgi:predicted Zn-dependent peptidase